MIGEGDRYASYARSSLDCTSNILFRTRRICHSRNSRRVLSA